MKQEQFDSLEKLLKSIKYVDKELINDKAFNEVVCKILDIKTNSATILYDESKYREYMERMKDDKPLKNIKFNEENPEMKKISENLIQTLNPYQFNEEIEGNRFKSTGINEMKFKPYSNNDNNNDNFLREQ